MWEKYRPLYNAADPAGPAADPKAPQKEPVVGDPNPDPKEPQTVPLPIAAELRAKLRESEAEREVLRKRAAEAEAIAARLAKDHPSANSSKVAEPSDADLDRRADAKVFQRDIRHVDEAGARAYGASWTQDVRALDAYGINTPDIIGAVLEIDRERSHEIMHLLAHDGEKAVALAAMTPVRRIAEITRLSDMAKPAKTADPANEDGEKGLKPGEKIPEKVPANANKSVSKAPPPAPALQPGASKTVDWRSDGASDEEFSKGWEENQRKRLERRASH